MADDQDERDRLLGARVRKLLSEQVVTRPDGSMYEARVTLRRYDCELSDATKRRDTPLFFANVGSDSATECATLDEAVEKASHA